jgi:hypothetical protein
MNKEEREALLAEAHEGDLAPGAAEELPLLADLLADPAMWGEPSPELKASVVRAIADADADAGTADRAAPKRRNPRRVVWSIVAAAAVVVIAIGVFAAVRSSANPDFKAQLSATGVVPGATGSADIAKNTAGFRVTLHTGGLQTLPAGEFYQAWLKNPVGTLVPIGTFSSSDKTVTLWSGVSPQEFSTLTVTIEKTDGNQASSGIRVLAGPVHAG